MDLNLPQIITGLILSVILGLISFRLKALTFSGTAGLIIIGTAVFGLGGIIAAAPLLFFYISSSLLSTIKTSVKETALQYAEKTGPRDIRQVLANGGVAAVMLVIHSLTGNLLWYFLFLAALAEAAADTWATEIGILSHRRPLSIVTFKKVAAGQSGGVTIAGLAAALTGAMMTTFTGLVVLNTGLIDNPYSIGLTIGFCGWMGSVFDSVLGGSVQAQYKCVNCGKLTEKKTHCRETALLHRGWRAIDNDTVNFASTLFTAILGLVLLG